MSKFWYIHFSAKNGDFGWCLLKIRDFSLKNENIKILTPKPILLTCKDQDIQKWAKYDNLVMSYYIFRDFSQMAIFSLVCWFFCENHRYFAEFSLFCICAYHFQKCLSNLCFGPIYSLFGHFLGELEPFLASKVPFLGPFYIGLYIRKVRFSDIPGRIRMTVESRHAIIFSFRKKIWWERC